MKKRFLLAALFTAGILAFFAVWRNYESREAFYESFSDTAPGRIRLDGTKFSDVTDEAVNDHYRSFYGWSELTDHRIFLDEENKQVIANFWFPADAPLWQIESARNYGKDTFLNKVIHNLSPHTYQLWVHGVDIEEILVEVFAEDQLLVQDHYRGNRENYEKEFFEDSKVTAEEQLCKDAAAEMLRAELEKLAPGEAQITVKKSVAEEKLFVLIESERKLLPKKLRQAEERLSNMETEYPAVTLELYEDNFSELYYRNTIAVKHTQEF